MNVVSEWSYEIRQLVGVPKNYYFFEFIYLFILITISL